MEVGEVTAIRPLGMVCMAVIVLPSWPAREGPRPEGLAHVNSSHAAN